MLLRLVGVSNLIRTTVEEIKSDEDTFLPDYIISKTDNIGKYFGGQNFRRTKIFRRTKFSAPIRNFSSFAAENVLSVLRLNMNLILIKFFRRTKFSAASQISGTFVRRQAF